MATTSSRPQLDQLIRDFNSAASGHPPLLVALDQEGGRVQRLRPKQGFSDYQTAKQVRASMSRDEAYNYYLELAGELHRLGFNLNLAPSVDLDLGSPAISKHERSYSPDPGQVTDYCQSFIKAHRQRRVLSCIKHFPGHGSALEDSHQALTDITRHWTKKELEPFRRLIERNEADFVMTAHLMHQSYDAEKPATLSQEILKPLLRESLGYDGPILSDDLHMGAILEYSSCPQDILLSAIRAEVDVLCLGDNPGAAAGAKALPRESNLALKTHERILDLIDRGDLRENHIEKSWLRIKSRKARLSLI